MIELKKRYFFTFIKRLIFVVVVCCFHISVYDSLSGDDEKIIYLLYLSSMTLIAFILFMRFNSFLESEFEKGNIYFYRYNPFAFLGQVYYKYSYNFVCHDKKILQNLIIEFNKNLIDNFSCQLKKINIIDCNNDLTSKDSRDFILGEVEPFRLKSTSLKILLNFNKIGNVYNLTWRIIMHGGRKDKIYRAIWFILLFPILFVFWIIPLIKGDKGIIQSPMLAPYQSAFNNEDIVTYINSINRVVLSVMVETLKSNNVDVSDLLESNIININGGNNQIGGSIINNFLNRVMRKDN